MEETDSFQNRMRKYMEYFQLTQGDVIQKCKPVSEEIGVKLAQNTLSQYLSGQREPKRDRVFLISKALGVDPGWLMGFNVPMYPQNEDEQENEIGALYDSLNELGQLKLIEYGRDLHDNPKYRK